MANLFSEKPLVKVVMLKGQDGEDKLINQADGSGLSFWIGTKAEYEAIPAASIVENCIYYITDDTRDDYRSDLNALDNKIDNHIAGLNQTLWTGAVSADSTAEEKVLTVTGIANYNLIALVVDASASGSPQSTTILAYRHQYTAGSSTILRFAGENRPSLLNTHYYCGVTVTGENQCTFSHAEKVTGDGEPDDIYLTQIIGIM